MFFYDLALHTVLLVNICWFKLIKLIDLQDSHYLMKITVLKMYQPYLVHPDNMPGKDLETSKGVSNYYYYYYYYNNNRV